MKTLHEVQTEIDLIHATPHALMSDKDKRKARKKLQFLNLVKTYLETKPTKHSITR